MSARRTSRRTLVVAGAALLGVAPTTACYRYVATPLASVPPAEDVRVRLTPQGATRLAPIIGVETTDLEGEVAPRGDSLAVSVVVARTYRGMAFDSTRQAIVLGPGEVADVQRRQFSRSRTTLAALGVVVGFAVLVGTIKAIADPNPSAEEPLPPPPPPSIKIPFPFRVSFP